MALLLAYFDLVLILLQEQITSTCHLSLPLNMISTCTKALYAKTMAAETAYEEYKRSECNTRETRHRYVRAIKGIIRHVAILALRVILGMFAEEAKGVHFASKSKAAEKIRDLKEDYGQN